MPWLEICIFTPLLGSLAVSRMKDRYQGRKWCVYITGLTFIFAALEFTDFYLQGAKHASDAFHLTRRLFGQEWFTIDQFSAPLLPLMALMYFLTSLTTLRTKVRRFSFASTLFSEAVTLSLYSCEAPWIIIALVAIGAVPPYLEMKARGKQTRVYLIHQAAFVFCLVVGWLFVLLEGEQNIHSTLAVLPLILGVLIGCGIAPFHCWITDLFENATFGTALLYVTRSTGAYVAIRLVVLIAPNSVLGAMGILSLLTAVYAAGMSLVQKDARRFFCYLFLSHSALVLVGMETLNLNGFTGALSVWISVVISLGGFGLALRAVESRRGRVQLADYQGLYDHMPTLAVCFLLTGLASVGFPGTIGFIGVELIVDSVVEEYPIVGAMVVIAAALNGIAVVHAYFLIFTGARHASSVSLQIGLRERYAMLTLAVLITLGGLIPQPGVNSRYFAAKELLREHNKRTGHQIEGDDDDSDDNEDKAHNLKDHDEIEDERAAKSSSKNAGEQAKDDN
jgi:NADH-quinone oxidoreductase subunit M